MIDERAYRCEQYLLQLSDDDLSLLSKSSSELAGLGDPVPYIRSRPELIEDLLGEERAFELVFGSLEQASMHFVSPFLLFAVAVHKTGNELEHTNFVTEWFGPRQRVPVFDASHLHGFLAEPERRLFLSQLLASYTHVSSGSVVVSTRRGLRRQRFSELDLTRLASLTDSVPESDRAALYRRLGDLSLFLTGVFPDHTASHGLSAIDRVRLLRSAGIRPDPQHLAPIAPESGQNEVVSLLENLGARWYRSASELDLFAPPGGRRFLADLAQHFNDARRVLNVLTDSFLFPFRSRFFGIGS